MSAAPDPLAAVLAEALHQEVAGVEPTITCTPDEEPAKPDDGGLFTLPAQPQTGGQHL